MVMSGDILKAKINKLPGNTQGVTAYNDYIFILSKGTFVDHVGKLRICFSCICKAGLRNNSTK